MKRFVFLAMCLCLLFCSAGADSVTLNILSGNEPYWEYQFAQTHPDIILHHSDVQADGQAYRTLLMTNDQYDVYEITLGPLYSSLQKKGYLLPLEPSDAVNHFTEAMHPYLRESLIMDDRLFAVPVPSDDDMIECVSWNLWSYAQELWQEESLGDLPKTYEDLLTRMIDWERNRSESAYRLIEADLNPGGFATAVFRAYVLQYENSNEPLSFDTAVFRQTMTLLKEYHDILQPNDSRQALILPYSYYLSETGDMGYRWIAPPAFEENQSTSISAGMSVYVINARTKHPKEALAYVEAALQSLNEPSLLMLIQQEAKEIKTSDWVAVTKEQAEQVQSFAKQVRMATQSEFLSGNHYYDMEIMIQQYLQGSLPLEMLVSQLNQRSWIVMNEREMLPVTEPGVDTD